jgi:arylsulfatase A-like enzyme
MGRNILFITTDQMRFDCLGVNGGTVAKVPVIDGLASSGLNYTRMHAQNVVCMPARSSMITGQYPRTHGVYANGVPLPSDAHSIAAHLNENGYHTALLGKAHFEPAFDFENKWDENKFAAAGSTGPYRGFDYIEFAMHGPELPWHYGRWLKAQDKNAWKGFYPLVRPDGKALNDAGGGDTGAPQVARNPIARELYHTDWVADRTIEWLKSVDTSENFFCWMSFPDPHHPWDPPESELHRINWRDLDIPDGCPESEAKVRAILENKPAHWMGYYDGSFSNSEGGPRAFVPRNMTHDQIREINALNHIENELIDEATGRVLAVLAERGVLDNTDIIITTDHGELQGDYGLMFKGPYHVDSLMRLPMVWKPAVNAGVTPAVIHEPVGQIDLAATFCEIAGVEIPDWVQGKPLPTVPGDATRERVLTEWDSQFPDKDMRLRSIWRDGYLCTVYEQGGPKINGVPMYDGTEGELYTVNDGPHQFVNRWDDPDFRTIRDDLVADMYASFPEHRNPRLAVEAPT